MSLLTLYGYYTIYCQILQRVKFAKIGNLCKKLAQLIFCASPYDAIFTFSSSKEYQWSIYHLVSFQD